MISKRQIVIIGAVVSLFGFVVGTAAEGYYGDKETTQTDQLHDLAALHDTRARDALFTAIYDASLEDMRDPRDDGGPVTKSFLIARADIAQPAAEHALYGACSQDASRVKPLETNLDDASFCGEGRVNAAMQGAVVLKPDCDVSVDAHEVPLDRYYDLIAKMATCALNAKTAVALRALDLLDSTRDEGDAAYNVFHARFNREYDGLAEKLESTRSWHARIKQAGYALTLLGILIALLKELVDDDKPAVPAVVVAAPKRRL